MTSREKLVHSNVFSKTIQEDNLEEKPLIGIITPASSHVRLAIY